MKVCSGSTAPIRRRAKSVEWRADIPHPHLSASFPLRRIAAPAGGAAARTDRAMVSETEVEMDRTVDVTIRVEPEAAAALADARNRGAVGEV